MVRDSASPSGWRFRGSYHAAINAYRRALEIVPSVHLAFRGQAFDRLPELLYTEPTHIRQGYALTPDTVRFGAFATMTRDTLEFVPRRLTDVVAAEPGAIPASVGAAVSHNREVMREIATTWVRAFPNRADAHETLALVLETLAELTVGRSKDFSAVSEIRRARATATEPVQVLRLANMQVRFLVKSEQMGAARALADSVLQANPNPTLDDARQLRGLAALTGHVHRAAQLQRRAAPDYTFLTPDWEAVTVPLPLTDAALGLFAYSAFGTPTDSLVALEQRVERLIPSYVQTGKAATYAAGDARHPGGARVSGAGHPPDAPGQGPGQLLAGDAVGARAGRYRGIPEALPENPRGAAGPSPGRCGVRRHLSRSMAAAGRGRYRGGNASAGPLARCAPDLGDEPDRSAPGGGHAGERDGAQGRARRAGRRFDYSEALGKECVAALVRCGPGASAYGTEHGGAG